MTGCERSDEGYSVRLFLRGTVPPEVRERQEHTVTRLERFEADHDVELEVRNWPREIPVDPVGVSETYLDLLDTFRAWANAQGRSLAPAVEVRRTYSWITAEQYATIALPVMLLAIYEGDRLLNVFPHADGDEVRTVAEGLTELNRFCTDEIDDGRTALAPSD